MFKFNNYNISIMGNCCDFIESDVRDRQG